jgi:hypothetical protein
LSRCAWRQTIILAALSLWLCAWTAVAWHAVQDDAFIHLRYADHLLRFHFITYDGIHHDFGTSSLLYVGILAAIRAFTTSPELPHILSVVQHIALFSAIAFIFNRFIPRPAVLARVLALLTLVLLVTPSGVRWFQDGMETGFTCLFAVLLITTVWCFLQLENFSAIHYATLFVLGLILVIHRVELGLPIVVAFVLLAFGRSGRTPFLRSALDAAPLLAGAALSAVFILATMHALLPDTAVAKSSGMPKWHDVTHDVTVILFGGMNIGAGLAVFWLITLVILLHRRQPTLLTALANSIFPITFFLAGLRGQEVQGARYLIWMFLFSVTWNVLEIGRPATGAPHIHSNRLPKILIYTFATILVLDMPVESYLMRHLLVCRAATEQIIRAEHLQQLSGLQGVAYEVGFIGYFTQAPICDMAGLVNGRAAAHLKKWERSARCASLHPDFVFGDWDQVTYFSQFHSLHGWQLCGTYDLLNVRGPATHFLLASPAATSRVCAAASGAIEPTPASLLPYLSATARP